MLAGYAYYQYDLQYNLPEVEPQAAEFVSGGVNKDGIPALTNPEYESIAAADGHLSDDGLGILVEGTEQAYFYPLVIMAWHEVINETIDGTPIVITYCPLCHSSVTYKRTLNDDVIEFGVSGQLLDNNLVMYDKETDSLWPQLKSSSDFEQYPSSQITFGQFKDEYPSGLILSRETGHNRDYTQDPYWQYYESDDIKFALSTIDGRLPAKQMVMFNNIPSYWFCWIATFPNTDISENLYEL